MRTCRKKALGQLLQIALWFLDPTRAFRVDPMKITVPVRLFVGLSDRVIPPYLASAVVAKVRDGKVHREARASHMPFLQDDRDRFFSWLLRELAALPDFTGNSDDPGSR